MVLSMSRPWKHPDTGIYWLRKRVPDGLRSLVGKREEKVSLKTRDPHEAKVKHAEALAQIERRWRSLKEPVLPLTDAQLTEATAKAYRAVIEKGLPDRVEWDRTLGERLWQAGSASWSLNDPDATSLWVGVSLMESFCREEAAAYARHFGMQTDDASMAQLAKALGYGIQKGALDVARRNRGDFSRPNALFDISGRPSESPLGPANPVPLESLLDGWAAEKSPAQKTLYTWTKTVEQLQAHLGHADAARITADEMIRWKEGLLKSGLRTKTIRDSKIAPVRAILQWGVDNRKIRENPAARVHVDVRAKLTERIRGYTDDEALLILEKAASETDPVLRWVPLLCAYSGARISEVCQLRREDVAQENGTWCMRFAPEAGSLKNAHSERAVPLHAVIVESGFLQFVARVRTGPLFSSLRGDRFGNRGGTGTKLIGRWVRSLGLDDERISPSHSWRHRFKTLGRRYGLLPDVVNAITGHHRKTVADAYGEFELATLYRELQKIPCMGLKAER